MDYVISASYGNDSMAMVRWAYEQGLKNVVVAYCDTGWASPGWWQKVGAGGTAPEGHNVLADRPAALHAAGPESEANGVERRVMPHG